MIRRASLVLVGALMGATAMGVICSACRSSAANTSTYRELAIFGDVFQRVRAQYVTPPQDDKLIENAINDMLTSLDPHSSYMNSVDAEDMRTQTRGEFGGLGIEVTMEDDLVKVTSPIDDTPAPAPACRRIHFQDRRPGRSWPESRGGGREDAWRRRHPDQADDPAQRRSSSTFACAFAQDRQLDRGADGATHLLDRILELQATNVPGRRSWK